MQRSAWFLHNLLSNLTSSRPITRTSTSLLMCILNHQYTDIDVGWVLLYVHRNHRLIRDGSPRRPPRLSHSSWALTDIEWLIYYIHTPTHPISIIYHRLTEVKIAQCNNLDLEARLILWDNKVSSNCFSYLTLSRCIPLNTVYKPKWWMPVPVALFISRPRCPHISLRVWVENKYNSQVYTLLGPPASTAWEINLFKAHPSFMYG